MNPETELTPPSETHPEIRPGAVVDSPAIVLSSTRYQENGKILRLMTLDFGKISVYAPGAMSSRKRFGGSLEPMSFVQAQLRFPRDLHAAEGTRLVQILKADLRDPFLHLRRDAELLETGAFAVRIVDDCVPEGQAEHQVFRALGRFLRDLSSLENPGLRAGWCRFALWNWMSRHFGFGDLRELLGAALPVLPSPADAAWERLMGESEPVFATFFARLNAVPVLRLTRKEESFIYSKWTETTGIHWPYFEQWILSF